MSRRMNWDKAKSTSIGTGRSSSEIPPSASQLAFIASLSRHVGAKNKKPKTMKEASDLIQSLKESKKKGVKPKHRRPAVPIKGKIVGK